jgi:hypothetical protein
MSVFSGNFTSFRSSRAAISSPGISPSAAMAVSTPAVFKKRLLVKDDFSIALSSESMMLNARWLERKNRHNYYSAKMERILRKDKIIIIKERSAIRSRA